MSLCSLDPQVLLPYQQHHPVVPWGTAPAATPSTGAGTAAARAAEGGGEGGGDVLPGPLPLPALRSRALGCVVGSSLADAAAMGVHVSGREGLEIPQALQVSGCICTHGGLGRVAQLARDCGRWCGRGQGPAMCTRRGTQCT